MEDPKKQPADTAAKTVAEAQANARLIASAPELLAALDQLASEYESLRFPNGTQSLDSTSPLAIARAAIAKATAR